MPPRPSIFPFFRRSCLSFKLNLLYNSYSGTYVSTYMAYSKLIYLIRLVHAFIMRVVARFDSFAKRSTGLIIVFILLELKR